jgi:Cu2+-exporting ATPase
VVDGHAVAIAGIGNPIREDVPEAVGELRRRGWKVGILSGDDPEVVARVAAVLGVESGESHGGMTPEAKLARIESELAHESVVMVGDGVNDAAALSAATVGVAVHGGAEASLSAADVYLSRPGLRPIVDLLGASTRTVRTIHRSLAVSLAYNGVAATLAMTGTIGPLAAAILMPISSFSVLAMAVGARTFGGD